MDTPKIHYTVERILSESAQDLVLFDVSSIGQVIAAQHSPAPDVWVADPDQYETNGRLHRDSDSSRLLAYASDHHIVYATDGCNSCTSSVGSPLENLKESELQELARNHELPLNLLKYLASLC